MGFLSKQQELVATGRNMSWILLFLEGPVLPQDAVLFKGTREGIHIFLNDEVDFPQVVHSLEDRLSSSRHFFQGARIVINTGKRSLSTEQVEQVRKVLNQHEGVQLLRLEQIRDAAAPQAGTQSALVIERTVRSGQQVYHQGHIVIIGDVNPGAEVIAEGNIMVLGTLRGTVHAGYSGKQDALVAATVLTPTQISIAGIRARRPDGEGWRNADKPAPEVARLRDGQIVVEPYQQAWL